MFDNEETTLDNFTTPFDIPENNILHRIRTTGIYEENDYNESLNNFMDYINEPMHNSSIYLSKIQKHNQTIFSEYPKDLLCFGALCFILFAIIGVLGNFVSILALSKCTRLRNATTAFIVNLCIADFLFCSFSMPLSALTFIQENWYYGDALCKLFPLVRYSNGAVSLFSVIAITINRYVLIVHPTSYPKVYTKRNMFIMIVTIWIISFLLLLPPLLGVWGTLGLDPDVGTCTILKLNQKSPKMFLYIFAFGVPSIIFIFCYVRIFFVVRKASRKSQRIEDKVASRGISFIGRKGLVSKHYRHSEMTDTFAEHRDRTTELRVLRVMLVIFIIFLVCYFPVSFVKIFHKESKLHYMNVLGYLGVYFSNIINPVIYIVMSKEYRMAYKELFCSCARKG